MTAPGANTPPSDVPPAAPDVRSTEGFPKEVKWFGIAVLLMVTQRVSVRVFALQGWESNLRRAIFLFTTIGVALVALKLRNWIGAWVVSAGLMMNLLPMLAHAGLMPVSIEKLQESGIYEVTEDDLGKPIPLSKDLLLRKEDIRFELLSDRFVLTLPIIDTNIYSAGDFVLFAGLCIATVEAVFRSVWGERSARRRLSTE